MHLDGQSVDRLTPRERDVAMVFQSYALYPHMTVAQNLSFGLRMRGIPKQTIQASVMEAARLLGQHLGRELEGRETKAGTRSDEAWSRFQQAEQMLRNADTLRWSLGDSDGAARALDEADRLHEEAEAFHERLTLTGVILTKLDGDARGGAAISVKAVTGKPIRYVGVGEHLDRLAE